MAYKSTILFDALNNVLVTKSLDIWEKHVNNPDFKDFTGFIFRKYLSMSPDPAVRREILNNQIILERLDDKNLYKWAVMNKNIPVQRSGFIKFIR